jgi:hypothetical protein
MIDPRPILVGPKTLMSGNQDYTRGDSSLVIIISHPPATAGGTDKAGRSHAITAQLTGWVAPIYGGGGARNLTLAYAIGIYSHININDTEPRSYVAP